VVLSSPDTSSQHKARNFKYLEFRGGQRRGGEEVVSETLQVYEIP
jgi:hypothetical protein